MQNVRCKMERRETGNKKRGARIVGGNNKAVRGRSAGDTWHIEKRGRQGWGRVSHNAHKKTRSNTNTNAPQNPPAPPQKARKRYNKEEIIMKETENKNGHGYGYGYRYGARRTKRSIRKGEGGG